MKEFQRKQIIRRIVYSIPSLIILLITAFFLVKGTVRVMDKGWESSERSRDLEKRAAALILREEELKGDIARLQTEEGVRDEIKEKFGHMLEAFRYGAPPHGGIAPGIDRIVSILQNEPNIREVIAFPKTGDGRDFMMSAPSEIDEKQLNELHIKVSLPKQKKKKQ